MNHPDDLLTDYVDGTLRGPDRDAVEAHLSVCERCREDVALASGAARALAAMPAPRIPQGLGDAAIREAARTPRAEPTSHGRRAATTSRWYRWIGAAAATAAVLIVLGLVLPNLGHGPVGGTVDRAGDSGGVTRPPATVVERVPGDLSTEDVQALALSYRAGAAPTANGGASATAGAEGAKAIPSGRPDAATPDQALTCLATAYPTLSGDPVRLLRTRFQGTPAYVGVFLSGPGAGQPADTATAVVAAVRDCRILSVTRARL